MCLVIAWFFIMTARYLALHGGSHALFSMEPIYNRSEFRLGTVMTATYFASLTYIGFDGVTTLAEGVVNLRRNGVTSDGAGLRLHWRLQRTAGLFGHKSVADV